MTDLADYLGKQVRRLVSGCRRLRARRQELDRHSAGRAGGCLIYRDSHVKAAGFEEFPKDTAGFLKLCQALKEKGTPAGFALGNATGDANGWATGSCGRTAARWSTRRTRW